MPIYVRAGIPAFLVAPIRAPWESRVWKSSYIRLCPEYSKSHARGACWLYIWVTISQQADGGRELPQAELPGQPCV